jgi:diguanylate cyclase (GGDEF)-like protein
MVVDGPIRGAPGGVTARVGAACKAVADHVAADCRLAPSVWLERGGRLRRVAGAGLAFAGDAIRPDEGVIGRTYAAGCETIVPDLAASGAVEGMPLGAVAEVCVPVRCGGRVVGALDVLLTDSVRAGDLDTLRDCAARLGEQIAEIGGGPADTGAWRLVRHMARLPALGEPDAIAHAALAAALDLTAFDSGVVVCRRPDGRLEPASLAGPLGAALASTPPSALEAIAAGVDDGRAGIAAGAPGEDVRPELAALRATDAVAFAALGLTTEGQCVGLLLLAAATPTRPSGDELELLDLLADQTASCLRTAELVRALRERAATDPLTGLGHHATFHEALSSSHRRPSTAVVVCDLDGFKRVNDDFGHQHGDRVLRGVAAALSGALRRGDRLFRIGGDEFAALLLVSGEPEALEAGMRLRDAVEDAALGVSVSIGIAVPHAGESDAALLARADQALYRVKASGRDGVALANDDPLPIAPPL